MGDHGRNRRAQERHQQRMEPPNPTRVEPGLFTPILWGFAHAAWRAGEYHAVPPPVGGLVGFWRRLRGR